MNPYAIIASLAVGTGLATAATTNTVIDFGLTGTTAMVGTINQFATDNNTAETATNMVLNTTAGADSGIRFSTSGGIFSAGGAGSFTPAGTTAYTTGSSVVDGWVANEEVAFGDVWQGLANASGVGGQTVSLTFTGLAANTDYTFKLLSGRANSFTTATNGNYALTYDGSTVTGGGTHAMAGSSAGANATNYTWTFSTGAIPANAVINLTEGWNINAITIAAVPEPSAAALLGLGGLALLRRRRK